MTDDSSLLFPLQSPQPSSSNCSTSQPVLEDVVRRIATRPRPLGKSKSLEKLSSDGPKEALGQARKLCVRNFCDERENGKEEVGKIRKLGIYELEQGLGTKGSDSSDNIKHIYEEKQPYKGGIQKSEDDHWK